MAKPLVIVESPAKARTLRRFLGNRYRIEASYGHVRDLPERASDVPAAIKKKPWGRLAVDVDGDFTPYYVISADKRKHIQELKTALKDASEVILATDPDREGESISWHLTEVLKPRVPVRRIVFHEITEEAVQHALENAHAVDEHLVRAQESRRILDRLFGYTLSPVLWKKVQTGLSAGRVQSIAVRLIVEREEERRAFRRASYWNLDARLSGEGRGFTATLVRVGDRRVATGRDFDASGTLAASDVQRLDEAEARQLKERLESRLPWRVTAVEAKPAIQRPAPPFTTSTLQQEANRKLGFSADRTMSAAQRLHDEGYISYHRTDSTTLSEKALREAARAIRERYGNEYYDKPRQYQTRVRNAQEAHEAIRPTDFTRAPQDAAGDVEADAARVYELVWQRAVASQMADARLVRTTLEITAQDEGGTASVFSSSGKAIEFPGFLRAYVEGSDDPAAELGDRETLLPTCRVGDLVGRAEDAEARLALNALDARGHETQPPARYTEASLVKRLEEEGIGRPSTYAPTINTISRRGYIFRQGKALVPSFTAFAVTQLLKQHFDDYVDVGFTAEMEEDLDQISNGERDWLEFVRAFYRGDGDRLGLEQRVRDDDSISYPVVDLGVDAASGETVRVRSGRYGPFVQLGEGGPGRAASIPDDVEPADFGVEDALALLKARAEGPRQLGTDPSTGLPIYVLSGRFGAYVQLGESPEKGSKAPKPKRTSLLPGMAPETITRDEALKLLSLPRELGPHPSDGAPVVAGWGRFGPYVKHGSDFRSLEQDDDVFAVDLGRALELFEREKRGRRRQAAKTVLREVGMHPRSGAKIQMLAGRYGPYVTDGTTNASLPKDGDPKAVTLDEAVALLEARAASGPPRRRVARRTPARGGARKQKSA
ncbi:MAG: type I DNA topoisomerase [Luteitalea sp.]|nr:type I DNA topoisomerase [Luteitalea sp.]